MATSAHSWWVPSEGSRSFAASRIKFRPARISQAALQLSPGEVSSQPELLAEKPKVGIIMGSDSDLSTMKHAGSVLDSFGICYQMTIVSAHRTAERMYKYASNAHLDDLNVIIAGAGGAAHLPGMVSSITPLPAIGVPVDVTAFSGLDSFLSIAQMPAGVPVATVAVDDAKNAGLLAVRILASSDQRLQTKVIAHVEERRRLRYLQKLDSIASNSITLERAASPLVGILTTRSSPGAPERAAAAMLESFGVPFEIVSVSSGYVRYAHSTSLKVLVVISAGYSDLPGNVAGATPLPVIGVPTSEGLPENGFFYPSATRVTTSPSLLEPVAWVGVDNGANAGILAARFLQAFQPSLVDKMISYKEELEQKVLEKAMKLESMGWKNYLIKNAKVPV